MKIGTNSIGNYGFKISKSSEEQIKLRPQTENNSQNQNENKISNEEKNFFKTLYPTSTEEIANYHFYESSGRMSGVKLGSLFDRRG